MGRLHRPIWITWAVAWGLLIATVFVHNKLGGTPYILLWGFAGMGIGIGIGLFIAYLLVGDTKEKQVKE